MIFSITRWRTPHSLRRALVKRELEAKLRRQGLSRKQAQMEVARRLGQASQHGAK